MEMVKMVCLSVMIMMVSITFGGAKVGAKAVTCEEPITKLAFCTSFLVGNGTYPIRRCCLAAAQLNAHANTTDTRRYLCKCFHQFAPALGVDPAKAIQLPSLCEFKSVVPLDPNVDCSSIP